MNATIVLPFRQLHIHLWNIGPLSWASLFISLLHIKSDANVETEKDIAILAKVKSQCPFQHSNATHE